MAKKPAMGRGLDAILPKGTPPDFPLQPPASPAPREIQPPVPDQSVVGVEVEISLIDENPFQPRKVFEESQLLELSNSIRELGLIQPLTVRKAGDRYQLISGERRLRASKLAKLEKIPVYIIDTDDAGMSEMALVENIQRADLNAMEIAYAFQRLIDEFKYTHEQLGPRVGKKRTTVTNYLRLLKLPFPLQAALRQGKMTMGHAKVLLSCEDEDTQISLFRLVESEDLSVRELEGLIQKKADAEAAGDASELTELLDEANATESNDYQPEMQGRLEQLLGWGVKVKPGKQGAGKVVITYRSEGERKELMERLNRIEE